MNDICNYSLNNSLSKASTSEKMVYLYIPKQKCDQESQTEDLFNFDS